MAQLISVHGSEILWGLIASGVSALVTLFIRFLIGYSKQARAMREGILWLQHSTLLHTCKVCLKLNSVDAEDLENLEGLYKSYKALGGNGTITTLYERVLKLYIKDQY